ncbi:hypothetical protein GF325_15120 [Candidatus Bathyarchaeota archaeon]|nr:hypothetical protein [Candidatus Bathyarchaeota archaeon]
MERSPSPVIFFKLAGIDSMRWQFEAFMDVDTVTVEENENGHYPMEIEDPHCPPVIIGETFMGTVARNHGKGLNPSEFSENTGVDYLIMLCLLMDLSESPQIH